MTQRQKCHLCKHFGSPGHRQNKEKVALEELVCAKVYCLLYSLQEAFCYYTQ